MLELKGPLFHSTLRYIKKRIGEEKFPIFVQKLPADLQTFLSKPILSSKFYPVDLLTGIAEGFATYIGGDPFQIYHDIGRTSAEEGASGIYKLFFMVSSPTGMLKTAGLVYKSYYSMGDMKAESTGKTGARIRILNSGIHHVSLCHRLSGFIERTMELTGGKRVIVSHPKCFTRGDSTEEWEGGWE